MDTELWRNGGQIPTPRKRGRHTFGVAAAESMDWHKYWDGRPIYCERQGKVTSSDAATVRLR
jgi:hypothetical protein